MDFIFEWGGTKAERNTRNHGVSFDEAQTVFVDPLSVMKIEVEGENDVTKRHSAARSNQQVCICNHKMTL